MCYKLRNLSRGIFAFDYASCTSQTHPFASCGGNLWTASCGNLIWSSCLLTLGLAGNDDGTSRDCPSHQRLDTLNCIAILSTTIVGATRYLLFSFQRIVVPREAGPKGNVRKDEHAWLFVPSSFQRSPYWILDARSAAHRAAPPEVGKELMYDEPFGWKRATAARQNRAVIEGGPDQTCVGHAGWMAFRVSEGVRGWWWVGWNISPLCSPTIPSQPPPEVQLSPY